MLSDPSRRLVLAARDRLGIRPLCYSVAAGELRFGGEAGAVAALPGQSSVIDEEQLLYQLALAWPDADSTLYRSVRRLPAGCRLVLRDGAARVTRYWTLTVPPRLHLGSDADYAAALTDVLTAAVRRRLDWCRQPVAELSGGIDSSLVAVIARDAGAAPLPVLTAAYPEVPESNETRYADAVVAGGGLLPSRVQPLAVDPVTAGCLRGLDEPFVLPQAALHAALFAGAQRLGADLVLTGEGGDELFTDSGVALTELLRGGRPVGFMREALALHREGIRLPQTLWRYGVAPFVPGTARSLVRRLRRRTPLAGIPIRPGKAVAARLDELDAMQGERSHSTRAAEGAARALADPAYQRAFEDIARLGSRFGVSVSHPFFDVEVVRFGLSLPGDQRLRRAVTRPIQRLAASRLPALVRERSDKSDLGPAFCAAFRLSAMELAARVVAAPPPPLDEILDREGLADLLAAVRGGAGVDAVFNLWRIVSVAAWLERIAS